MEPLTINNIYIDREKKITKIYNIDSSRIKNNKNTDINKNQKITKIYNIDLSPQSTYFDCKNDIKQHYSISKLSSDPTICQTSYNANQLIQLYNVPSISPNNITTRVVSIAIIIANSWGQQNVTNDLKIFWNANFPTIPIPKVTVYTMPGATITNSIKSGWNVEEMLDIEMICAINPNANIYVVEAKSNSGVDLISAIKYATDTLNADIISMSWGGGDNTYLSSNSIFINPTNSTNYKCFCASTGDNNSVSWPAVLSNVLAVGGTSLVWSPTNINTINRVEYTWPSAGCGYSTSCIKPLYQSNVNSTNNRAIPDISLVANTFTGVNIVCNSKWLTIGGTSVSCPISAGILSIANQKRFNINKKPLTTVYTPTPTTNSTPTIIYNTNVQNYLYKSILTNQPLYNSCFNDVLIGTDGKYSASQGYDIATGIGSPNVTNLCNALANNII